jgi:hypothetical protein
LEKHLVLWQVGVKDNPMVLKWAAKKVAKMEWRGAAM